MSITTIWLTALTRHTDSSPSPPLPATFILNNNNNNNDQQQQQQHFASELTTRATASYMRRHMLDNVPNVTCNDGTKAGYYIRQNYNSQRWLIFLEGGWHCFNEKSCQQRWLKMKHFMTSKHWPELKNGEYKQTNKLTHNTAWVLFSSPAH